MGTSKTNNHGMVFDLPMGALQACSKKGHRKWTQKYPYNKDKKSNKHPNIHICSKMRKANEETYLDIDAKAIILVARMLLLHQF